MSDFIVENFCVVHHVVRVEMCRLAGVAHKQSRIGDGQVRSAHATRLFIARSEFKLGIVYAMNYERLDFEREQLG